VLLLLFRVAACAKCSVRRYCTRDCQVAHWKAGHKRECEHFARLRQQTQTPLFG
jgi:ubiquitin carboxyl-terminal hydrolase 36/42